MVDEMLSIYGTLDNFNKRLKEVEAKSPDYIADMFQVHKALGALTNRIIELERKFEEYTSKNEKGA